MNTNTTPCDVQDLTPEVAAAIAGSGGFYDLAASWASYTVAIVVDAVVRVIGG